MKSIEENGLFVGNLISLSLHGNLELIIAIVKDHRGVLLIHTLSNYWQLSQVNLAISDKVWLFNNRA